MNGLVLLADVVPLIPEWMQYGAFGLLTIVLLGIGKLLRDAGKWTGEHAVRPIRDAAVGYLNKQTEHTEKNTELLSDIQRGQRIGNDALANLSESVRNLYCAKHSPTEHGR